MCSQNNRKFNAQQSRQKEQNDSNIIESLASTSSFRRVFFLLVMAGPLPFPDADEEESDPYRNLFSLIFKREYHFMEPGALKRPLPSPDADQRESEGYLEPVSNTPTYETMETSFYNIVKVLSKLFPLQGDEDV
jgi:hypothetical protein